MQRQYRTPPTVRGIELKPGADVSGLFFGFAYDFSNLDLRGVCFRGTVFLRGTNFSGSNLEGAIFDFASALDCNFTDTMCVSTSFQGAMLKGSNFRNANCQKANLEGADLGGYSGAATCLDQTDFSDSNLCDVMFTGDMSVAIFSVGTQCNKSMFNYSIANLEFASKTIEQLRQGPQSFNANFQEGLLPRIPQDLYRTMFNYSFPLSFSLLCLNQALLPLINQWRFLQDVHRIANNKNWPSYTNRFLPSDENPSEIKEIQKILLTKLNVSKQYADVFAFAKRGPVTQKVGFWLLEHEARHFRHDVTQAFLDGIVSGNLDGFSKDENQPLVIEKAAPKPSGP